MTRIFSLFLFICLLDPVLAGAQNELDTIKTTTRQVLEQLNSSRARLKSEPEYIQHVVRELIVPHFDFDLMSRLVMGSHWQEFARPAQSCFVAGFRNLLVERYAYILLSYDDHEIVYEPTENIGSMGARLVRQSISRAGANPLPIEYAMEEDGDEWKVVDLIIDGVSLVRSHRGMFQSRIHTQGREYFINSFPECHKLLR